MATNDLKDTAAFIRQYRSNEANFDKLYERLQAEIRENNGSKKYVAALQDIESKSAVEYKTASNSGKVAWPEFEKFVSDFEKAVINVT